MKQVGEHTHAYKLPPPSVGSTVTLAVCSVCGQKRERDNAYIGDYTPEEWAARTQTKVGKRAGIKFRGAEKTSVL